MFNKARLKLTGWYLFMIMCVSITFSLVIARAVNLEVERFERMQRFRIENNLNNRVFFFSTGGNVSGPPPLRALIQNPELLEETKRRVFTMLGIINFGIFAVSGIMGYILAGRTLAPIKEMMDEQNRFISDASHELRTPLTSLKTAFEVYLRNRKTTQEEAKILIKESVAEVNKLQSLSDSLLQLAQYEKPNNHPVFEEVLLAAVVKQAIHKIMPLAKQKEIKIRFEEKPFTIRGSKDSLIDLMVILLDNAVKYSEKGGNVDILISKEEKWVSVKVTDRGMGIGKHELPHIFDRFYRADTARSKTQVSGYGLGLSIAKKITSIHKGSIFAASKVNKGTAFTVKFPIFSQNSD